jgi:GT2 family glycosyltransferase
LKPLVYTVIVVFNGMKWIPKCLESIRQSTIQLYPVIIDNKSTDDSATFIEREYPEFILIKNKENLGFGNANNIGLKIALQKKADHILLLNQDAYLFSNTVEKLISAQNSHADNFIVTPVLFKANEKDFEVHFQKMAQPKYCPGFLKDLGKDTEQKMPYYPVYFMHAAVWLLSKECIESIGGFDPLYSHNSEDSDYINRIKYFEKQIVISPNAYAVHDTETLPVSYDILPGKKRRRLYFVTNVAQLKNINDSFFRAFCYIVWYNLKSIGYNLLRLRFIIGIDRSISWLRCIMIIRTIISHRRICRMKQPNFLS